MVHSITTSEGVTLGSEARSATAKYAKVLSMLAEMTYRLCQRTDHLESADMVYKFAVVILDATSSMCFAYTGSPSLATSCLTLSYNFITDDWIDSGYLARCMCTKSPTCATMGTAMVRACQCYAYRSPNNEYIKDKIVKYELGWNLFGLYLRHEENMYFARGLDVTKVAVVHAATLKKHDDYEAAKGMHSLV